MEWGDIPEYARECLDVSDGLQQLLCGCVLFTSQYPADIDCGSPFPHTRALQ